MSDGGAISLIWILGCMVLVGSALLARRRWGGQRLWPMALAWIAIFALLFLVAHWIDARG